MKLKDRVAIVTGAGQGIGKAIGRCLAEEGTTVVINDINETSADSAAEDLRNASYKADAFQADVSDSTQVQSMIDFVLGKYGKIDILVNNAGVSSDQVTIENIPEEEWDKIITVNLKGPFLCSKAVISTMKKERYGRIINIVSAAGRLGRTASALKTKAHYCASKAGLISLTKSLALELAPWRITANAVAAGPVATEMTAAYNTEEACRDIPLNRFGNPEEIGKAVAFLASGDSAYITGITVDVSGGLVMI